MVMVLETDLGRILGVWLLLQAMTECPAGPSANWERRPASSNDFSEELSPFSILQSFAGRCCWSEEVHCNQVTLSKLTRLELWAIVASLQLAAAT